jgi:hypothetical protein
MSSKRLVEVLDPVVEPPPALMVIGSDKLLQGGAVRAQPVGDDGLGLAVARHHLLDEI